MTNYMTTKSATLLFEKTPFGWKILSVDGYEWGKSSPFSFLEKDILFVFAMEERSPFIGSPLLEAETLKGIEGEYGSHNCPFIIHSVGPFQEEYKNYKEEVNVTITFEKPRFELTGLDFSAPPGTDRYSEDSFWKAILEAGKKAQKEESQFSTEYVSFYNGSAGSIQVSGDGETFTISLFLCNGAYDNAYSWLEGYGCPEELIDFVANDNDPIWCDYKDSGGDWAISDFVTVSLEGLSEEEALTLLADKAKETWESCCRISDEFFESVKNAAEWARDNREDVLEIMKKSS